VSTRDVLARWLNILSHPVLLLTLLFTLLLTLLITLLLVLLLVILLTIKDLDVPPIT
jgi:hypothetical protein